MSEKISTWKQRSSPVSMRDLDHLAARVQMVQRATTVSPVRLNGRELHLDWTGQNVVLSGASRNARLSWLAFEQLCNALDAPADFLRELPEDLVCQVLNRLLMQLTQNNRGRPQQFNLLFASLHDGDYLVRGLLRGKNVTWDTTILHALRGMLSTHPAGSVQAWKVVWNEETCTVEMINSEEAAHTVHSSHKFYHGITFVFGESQGKELQAHPWLYEPRCDAILESKSDSLHITKKILSAIRIGQYALMSDLNTLAVADMLRLQIAERLQLGTFNTGHIANWLQDGRNLFTIKQAASVAAQMEKLLVEDKLPRTEMVTGLQVVLATATLPELRSKAGELLKQITESPRRER